MHFNRMQIDLLRNTVWSILVAHWKFGRGYHAVGSGVLAHGKETLGTLIRINQSLGSYAESNGVYSSQQSIMRDKSNLLMTIVYTEWPMRPSAEI